MRTIDGTRYISAKEYAEIMNITVGRVSQIKAELPFVKIEEFGIEVINFDILDLQLKEKTFVQTKFETSNPLHTYTYKDMGSFFSKFALDLVQFKGNAEIRIEELQNKNQELSQYKIELEGEVKHLKANEKRLEEELDTTKTTLQEKAELNDGLSEMLNESKSALKDIQEKYEEIIFKNESLEVINKDLKHDLEIKVLEQNTLNAEKENLKEKVADLNNQMVKAKDELNEKDEIVVGLQAQNKELLQSIEANKINNKELEHQVEIKLLECKTLVTANQNLKNKVVELEKQIRSEKDLKEELNDLRKRIENISNQNSENSQETKNKAQPQKQ